MSTLSPSSFKPWAIFFILTIGSLTTIATSPIEEHYNRLVEERSIDLPTGEEQASMTALWAEGPFDADLSPLVLTFYIHHIDPFEEYGFEEQTWSLLIGETSILELWPSPQNSRLDRQRYGVELSEDDDFTEELSGYALSGDVTLSLCDDTQSDERQEDGCLPCDPQGDQCEVSFTLLRSGEPLHAVSVDVNFYHDLPFESPITLNVTPPPTPSDEEEVDSE